MVTIQLTFVVINFKILLAVQKLQFVTNSRMDMSTLHIDSRMDMSTLHIVSYFVGADVFMSFHKLIITLTPFMSLPTVFMQNISP